MDRRYQLATDLEALGETLGRRAAAVAHLQATDTATQLADAERQGVTGGLGFDHGRVRHLVFTTDQPEAVAS